MTKAGKEASETLDDLLLGGLKVFQPKSGHRFSIDAVLLAHFPRLDGVSHAIDLGTGNGVIPLLLSCRKPSLRITGIEIQPEMVKRARKSVSYNDLEERITIKYLDIRAIPGQLERAQADLITSNPPFWKAGEGKLNKNREIAAARHEITVTLSDIIEAAAHLLKEGGRLAIIHRAERCQELQQECVRRGFHITRLRMVQSFAGQKAKLVLVEACQGRGPAVSYQEPPLIIYQAAGVYSPEVMAIYDNRMDK